jgi:hypothetical protein
MRGPVSGRSQTQKSGHPYKQRYNIMVTIADAESTLRTGTMFIVLVWAYFKFARGRLFRPRLEMTISGSPTRHRECYHVIVRYTVRNIGLRRVTIDQAGSDICVEIAHPASPAAMIPPTWKLQGSHPVLQNHRRIESGGAVSEEIMILLPDAEAVALRLVLKLEATQLIRLGRAKRVWYAQSVVSLPRGAGSAAEDAINAQPERRRLPSTEEPRPDTEAAALEGALGNL